jgi:prophage regulatory protein
MKNDAPASSRLLRLPDVQHLTGLAQSTIYKRIALGEFPAPVGLGGRAVAWRERDVVAWVEARPVALGPVAARSCNLLQKTGMDRG